MHLMLCLLTLSTLVFALHQYRMSLVSTVSTIRIQIQMEGFSSGIQNVLLKLPLYRQCQQSGFRWKAFHLVFEMFYSNYPCIDSIDNPDSDGRLFIWYSKCSTQMTLVSTVSTIWINWGLIRIWIQTEDFSSGIHPVFEMFYSNLYWQCRQSECWVFTPHRATNTIVDSVDKHSIKCIACFDLRIDSVDKQDTLLNTQ